MGVHIIPGVREWRRAETARREKTRAARNPDTARETTRNLDTADTETENANQRDMVVLSNRAARLGFSDGAPRGVSGLSGSEQDEIRKLRERLQDLAAERARAAQILEDSKAQMKQAEQYAKAMARDAKNLRIALKIARRIASGGHVPRQDEQWLMEYSQTMYFSAKMEAMRAEENHKKYDSLLESEEDEQSKAGSAESGSPDTADALGAPDTAGMTSEGGAPESV